MKLPKLNERRELENERLRQELCEAGPGNISYDFFKHMVSLSVLTLGGIVGMSEGLFAGRITLPQMMIASGLIAASGIVALQCQSDIVQVARGRKEPTIWLRWGHRIVPALFGAGIGAFLILVSEVI